MADNPRWTRRSAGSPWGDLGADGERGRLNPLTPKKALQGITEVKVGKTFCLSLPLDYPVAPSSARAVTHRCESTPELTSTTRWDSVDAAMGLAFLSYNAGTRPQGQPSQGYVIDHPCTPWCHGGLPPLMSRRSRSVQPSQTGQRSLLNRSLPEEPQKDD
jgi:hypothetical protein